MSATDALLYSVRDGEAEGSGSDDDNDDSSSAVSGSRRQGEGKAPDGGKGGRNPLSPFGAGSRAFMAGVSADDSDEDEGDHRKKPMRVDNFQRVERIRDSTFSRTDSRGASMSLSGRSSVSLSMSLASAGLSTSVIASLYTVRLLQSHSAKRRRAATSSAAMAAASATVSNCTDSSSTGTSSGGGSSSSGSVRSRRLATIAGTEKECKVAPEDLSEVRQRAQQRREEVRERARVEAERLAELERQRQEEEERTAAAATAAALELARQLKREQELEAAVARARVMSRRSVEGRAIVEGIGALTPPSSPSSLPSLRTSIAGDFGARGEEDEEEFTIRYTDATSPVPQLSAGLQKFAQLLGSEEHSVNGLSSSLPSSPLAVRRMDFTGDDGDVKQERLSEGLGLGLASSSGCLDDDRGSGVGSDASGQFSDDETVVMNNGQPLRPESITLAKAGSETAAVETNESTGGKGDGVKDEKKKKKGVVGKLWGLLGSSKGGADVADPAGDSVTATSADGGDTGEYTRRDSILVKAEGSPTASGLAAAVAVGDAGEGQSQGNMVGDFYGDQQRHQIYVGGAEYGHLNVQDNLDLYFTEQV